MTAAKLPLAPVAILFGSTPKRAPAALDAKWIARRGNHAAYYPGETNRCPGCGRTQWQVGRTMAECCHCAAGLPIARDGDVS